MLYQTIIKPSFYNVNHSPLGWAVTAKGEPQCWVFTEKPDAEAFRDKLNAQLN